MTEDCSLVSRMEPKIKTEKMRIRRKQKQKQICSEEKARSVVRGVRPDGDSPEPFCCIKQASFYIQRGKVSVRT